MTERQQRFRTCHNCGRTGPEVRGYDQNSHVPLCVPRCHKTCTDPEMGADCETQGRSVNDYCDACTARVSRHEPTVEPVTEDCGCHPGKGCIPGACVEDDYRGRACTGPEMIRYIDGLIDGADEERKRIVAEGRSWVKIHGPGAFYMMRFLDHLESAALEGELPA